MTAAGVPGAVLLSRQGGATIEVASGVSDIATHAKTTTRTRFRTGSVAKTFVATVVMQLSNEGILSLDDTVDRWLPGMVPGAERISIRQLLGNRSGLFDFANDPQVLQPYMGGDLAHVWKPAALVSVATAHPANFEPGTATLYSNTDYTVLGLVIEAATRHPVSREIETRIIDPLGLDSTSVPRTAKLNVPFAHGYFVTKDLEDVTFLDPSMSSFGGNLVSTVDDLATFYPGAVLPQAAPRPAR